MQRMRRAVIVAVLALGPSIPRPSGACDPVPDSFPFAVDPAHASDTTPPSAVTGAAMVIPSSEADAGCGGTKCGSGGTRVVLQLQATDDRTPAGQLGFRLVAVGGQVPSGLVIPAAPLQGDFGSEVRLRFAQEPRGRFAFDLEVRAVDLAGNEGPPAVIAVRG